MDSLALSKTKVLDAPPTFETVVSLTANTSVPTTTSARTVEPARDGVLASTVIVEVAAPTAMVTSRKPNVLVATSAYKFPLLVARAGMSVTVVGMVYVAAAVDGDPAM